MLTTDDDSSLVVDSLWDLAGGPNTAVTGFYFNFAARKEQSATNMLSSLLKQMIREWKGFRRKYRGHFKRRRRSFVGENLSLWISCGCY